MKPYSILFILLSFQAKSMPVAKFLDFCEEVLTGQERSQLENLDRLAVKLELLGSASTALKDDFRIPLQRADKTSYVLFRKAQATYVYADSKDLVQGHAGFAKVEFEDLEFLTELYLSSYRNKYLQLFDIRYAGAEIGFVLIHDDASSMERYARAYFFEKVPEFFDELWEKLIQRLT